MYQGSRYTATDIAQYLEVKGNHQTMKLCQQPMSE